MTPIRRILVPVDYTDHAIAVVRYAAELARMAKASLELLHVWECEPGVPADVTVRMADGSERKLASFVEEQAESGMSDFLKRLALPSDVSVNNHVSRGSSAKAIVQEAKQIGADMIVMGTSGRTGFEHVLLGSVAEKVLRNSTIPVLTIPLKGTKD
jgi:nucleotide-binding universal stress UspA family protein